MSQRWRTATLGEMADRSGGIIQTGPFGSQLHRSDYVENGTEGVPLVMPKNMVDGRVEYSTIARVEAKKAAEMARHSCTAGDVLLARRGEIGRCAFIRTADARVLCGTGSLRVGLRDPDLDPEFLFHYLSTSSVRAELEARAVGATMPNLNAEAVRAVVVPLPPLTTQRKIAATLSAYDDLIDINNRRIEILEEMAQRIYREWFVDFRYPGHEEVALVESELGPIPEGWMIDNIDGHVEVIRGRSYRSVDIADEGGVPFFGLKCIARDGGFRPEGIKRYIGEFKEGQKASAGDIVVAVTDMTQERRIVARAARIPDVGEEFGVFSMDLVKVAPKDLPTEHVLGLLRYSEFPDRVKAHANGANVLHLHPDRIRDYRFAVPVVAVAHQYADQVGPMRELSEKLEAEIERLRATRDLLLPRLVSGEIDVSDLDIAAPDRVA